MEHAWERRSQLRDPSRFRSWFDRILVNECRDHIRRRARVRFIQSVMTVSEVLADRAAGGLRNQSVAVGGYWSDVTIPTTGGCMLPGMTGEPACASALEGITELDEPLMAFGKYYETIYQATGPHISPYVPRELPRRDELFMASYGIENRFITTPIVVVGHFDDPRSEYCEPDFKQRCMDRLVVDTIAYFNRALTHVWTPAPGVPTIEPPPP